MSAWMLYATLVALLAGAAASMLERSLHSYRVALRWIWAGAIAGSCAIPVIAWMQPDPTPIVSATESYVVTPASNSLSELAPEAVSEPSWLTSIIDAARLRPTVLPMLPSRLDPLARWMWALLTLVVVGALGGSFASLRQSRREWASTRVDGRDILVSEEVGPAVVGVIRPAIVMPRWSLDLPPQDRELVLRHEEEHRRAGDIRLLFVSLILLALLPWNAPLWWQVRRLRMAVELDCDRRVLSKARELRRYASLLVEMGRRGTVSRLGALALAHPAPFLERRIRTMTTRSKPRHARTAAFALFASMFALVAYQVEAPPPPAELAALQAAAAAAEQPTSGRIVGRVTLAKTGNPVSDVEIQLAGSNIGTTSVLNGMFVMLDVPPGTYQMTARHEGFGALQQQVTIAEDSTLELKLELPADLSGLQAIRPFFLVSPSERSAFAVSATEPTTELDATASSELPRGANLPDAAPVRVGRITGRAIHAVTREPLADVQVYLVGARLGSLSRANGAFVLINVPAGAHTVRAERIGFAAVEREITVTDGSVLEQTFEMYPLASGLDEIPNVGRPARPLLQPGDQYSTTRPQAEPAAVVGRVDVANAGATVGSNPSSRLGRITGRITDAATQGPLSDVQVYLVGQNVGAISRQNGVFVILNVPAGTYELRAEREGLATMSRAVTVAGGVALEEFFQLTPRSVESRDAIILDMPPGSTTRPEAVVSPGVSSQGQAQVRDGRAVVVGETPTRAGVTSSNSVRGFPTQVLGRITGRVVDRRTQAPLSDVQVYLVGANIGSLTRSNGAFVILNVPSGTYEIRAERIGLTTVAQTITVGADAALEINFELSAQAMRLDEIVVTGTAGAARRREIGNAIVSETPAQAQARQGSPFVSGVPGVTTQAVPQSQTAPLRETPQFTPHTVRPELLNATEVQRALIREYPPAVRDAQIGGTIVVWLFIDATGVVDNVRLQTPSGIPALDQAALNVARTMRFSPAYNRDQVVPVWVSIPITFRVG